MYDLKCSSDPVRLGKHHKKKGITISAITTPPLVDNKLVTITSDGTLYVPISFSHLFYQLDVGLQRAIHTPVHHLRFCGNIVISYQYFMRVTLHT